MHPCHRSPMWFSTVSGVLCALALFLFTSPASAQPPGPVANLSCSHIAGTQTVEMTWMNRGPYTAIDIFIDGIFVAGIPIDAETYTAINLTPGNHVFCVIPVSGGIVHPARCCAVPVPLPQPPSDVTCTVLPGTTDVLVTWVNQHAYTGLELWVNGAYYVTLGTQESQFPVEQLLLGTYEMCVHSTVGPAALPPVCCTIDIVAPPPPTNLVCQNVTGTDTIQATWNNLGPYVAVEVMVDGAVQPLLPGDATSFIATGLTPGDHTICVTAHYPTGTPVGSPIYCDAFVSPAMIGIDCHVPVGAIDAEVQWINAAAYDQHNIYVDGQLVHVATSNPSSYEVIGLAVGTHTICVEGVIGTSVSPQLCCTATIAAGTPIIRGDCNEDGLMNIADPVLLLSHLFVAGVIGCQKSCDVNDDGTLDISDPVFALSALFAGGALPPHPFPGCGLDTTADALGCAGFAGCP